MHPELAKIVAQYTKIVETCDDFFEKNEHIIREYDEMIENKRLAGFIVSEKVEMLIEEGTIKVGDGFFTHNDKIEFKISKDGVVNIFEKKLYGKAHIPQPENDEEEL